MKCIMVMFDSLNRRFLSPYGCRWVHTPNFQRLADRAVTFTNAYVGSMPCMPARRELHTGRYNFLHRSWGPMEPFDDSMPQILREAGVCSHLISDHYHYWEDGGCTYHTRYSNWEISRGQEGDPWKADLTDGVSVPAETLNTQRGAWGRQDWVNRHHMQREADTCQAKTFAMAEQFLRTNHAQDNWFCQIETFDPHEPYFVPQKYVDLYEHSYAGPHWDWPPYELVNQPPEQVEHVRILSAALHSMCDAYLGKVLDLMDELSLWDDTMLIVNTDHGFLLSEHDCWGKCWAPFYNEVAHMPLFVWDPRCGRAGERNDCLVQTIDLPATLLELFGQDRPPDMQGAVLRETIASDRPVRQASLFGQHGGHVNVTDGRYVYMRAACRDDNRPLYQYTVMPTHMRSFFSVDELRGATLAEPFSFTKGCPVLKVPSAGWRCRHEFRTMLFDLHADPGQEHPLDAPAVERRMIDHLVERMRANDAPREQFERLGLTV